jgi:hypothetical protein
VKRSLPYYVAAARAHFDVVVATSNCPDETLPQLGGASRLVRRACVEIRYFSLDAYKFKQVILLGISFLFAAADLAYTVVQSV